MTIDFTKPRKTARLISLDDFYKAPGVILEDERLLALLRWFVEIAKNSGINIDDIDEMLVFLRYLAIKFVDLENLLVYMKETELSIREIANSMPAEEK